MNNCYTTLLSSNDYVYGVVTQFLALKKFGAKEDYICLIADDLDEETYRILNNVGIKYHIYSATVQYTDGLVINYPTTINKFRGFELKTYDKIMFLDADLIPLENFDTLFNYNVPLLCLCGTGLPSGGLFIYDPKEYDFEELVNIYKDHCWNDEQQLTMMWFTNAMLTNNWISIYGPTPFNERIQAFHWGGGPRFWDLFELTSIEKTKDFVENGDLIEKIKKGYNYE